MKTQLDKKFLTIFSGVFVFYLLMSMGCSNQKAAKPQSSIVESLQVDSVTADFPVGFSSLSYQDWQFVAYYNKNRHLTVASRKIPAQQWNYNILPTKVGWDSHNRITMAFDRDNCIHLSGNMHNDSMTYFKTDEPLDISTFKKVFPLVAVEDELSCTYPEFLKSPDNRIVYTYRKGGSGNGITITTIYDERTSTFTRLSDQPLFDGLNQMSAYASGPRLGPDRMYHLCWLWRNTPSCETNHSLSYARSSDLVHWETVDGTSVELPITPNTKQFMVDPVPPKGGAINGNFRLFFNRNQKPLLAYLKYDDQGNSQIYLANPSEGGWTISQVTDWSYRWEFSGPGSVDFEIKIKDAEVDANNRLHIRYWHVKRGDGELIVDLNSLSAIADKKLVREKAIQYPEDLLKPISGIENASVNWMKLGTDPQNPKAYYAFRWETQGKRRFYKPPETPVGPTPLKLYKFEKDAEIVSE